MSHTVMFITQRTVITLQNIYSTLLTSSSSSSYYYYIIIVSEYLYDSGRTCKTVPPNTHAHTHTHTHTQITYTTHLLLASSSESKKLVESMSLLIIDDVASKPCDLCRMYLLWPFILVAVTQQIYKHKINEHLYKILSRCLYASYSKCPTSLSGLR